MFEIVTNSIKNPVEVIAHHNEFGALNQKIRYFIITTGYNGFLPLASTFSIVAILMIFINLFSGTHPHLCINFYYTAPIIPIFFYSMILVLSRTEKSKKKN